MGILARPASAVAAASMDTIALCGGQLKGLSVKFRDPPMMGIPRGAGGVTTLLFLGPALIAQRRGDERRARWWAMQTVAAFLADYVFVGGKSAWHGIDRVCASYSVASLLARSWRGSSRNGTDTGSRTARTRAACISAGIPAIMCKARAFKAVPSGAAAALVSQLDTSRAHSAWNVWHAMWHVMAAPAAMLVEARA